MKDVDVLQNTQSKRRDMIEDGQPKSSSRLPGAIHWTPKTARLFFCGSAQSRCHNEGVGWVGMVVPRGC